MPQHVLVTGGAGYVGSILTEHLLADGFRVTVVDNLSRGQQGTLFHLCHNERFDFVRGDVRDESLMKRLVASVDVICPLAAIVGAPACELDTYGARSINLDAIRMINRLRSKDQLVVYPNTNSGYGTQTGEAYCDENTPLEPISLYGTTKVDAERELLASPNSVTLRLATVFGFSPRMRIDLLVNHFVYAALTDGYLVIFEKHFKRNYIHIRDVADTFVFAIRNASRMVGRPYNVGLDEANLSKEELATKIKESVPKLHLTFSEIGSDPDKRNYIVSNQRLREAGFVAKRTVDQGIAELIKGYRLMGRGPYTNL